jgi:IS1 family transposase
MRPPGILVGMIGKETKAIAKLVVIAVAITVTVRAMMPILGEWFWPAYVIVLAIGGIISFWWHRRRKTARWPITANVPAKVYGNTSPSDQRRYSPPPCVGAIKGRVKGKPDPEHISTSFAERQNLNIRMHTRRFTRLTNAFSKKVENHALSVALFAMYYNFVRIHKTLRVTPAMAAGVTDRLWEIGDVVKMLEDWENQQKQAA